MTKLLSACCVASALWLGSASLPAEASPPRFDGFAAAPVLAQTNNDQNRSTRVSGRGAVGLVKLVVLLGAGAIGVGGWLFRKMSGGD